MKIIHERAANLPETCPICNFQHNPTGTSVELAGGTVYRCESCAGYFLFPPREIEYTGSGWSVSRANAWVRDVNLAKVIVPRIVTYLKNHFRISFDTVLEIGCGSGFMGMGFKSAGIEYTGIDIDLNSIALGQKYGLDLHPVPVENITSLNKKFDLVISSNVFEHFNKPFQAFSDLTKICNQAVIIIVPNANGLYARLKANPLIKRVIQKLLHTERDVVFTIDGYWHNIAYSKQTLLHLCSENGVKPLCIKSISINDPVFGFVQRNNSLLYRLASFFARILGMDSTLLMIGIIDN